MPSGEGRGLSKTGVDHGLGGVIEAFHDDHCVCSLRGTTGTGMRSAVVFEPIDHDTYEDLFCVFG